MFNLFRSKSVDFSSGLNHWPFDIRKVTYFNQVIYLDCLSEIKDFEKETAVRRSNSVEEKVQDRRDGLSDQKAERIKYLRTRQVDLAEIRVTFIEYRTRIVVIA